jgi:hypothetical protein
MHGIEVDMRAVSNENLWQFIRDVTSQLSALPFSNGRSDYHAQIDSMRLNAYLVLLQCEVMRRGHGVADHPELRGYLKDMQGLRKVAKRLLFSVLPEWTLGLFGERGTKGNEGAANQNMANAQEFYNSGVLAQDLPSLPELPNDFANDAFDALPAPEVVSAVVASENGGEANAANNAANKIVKLASKRAVSARQSR